jgi:hypothetical protein
MTRIRSPTDRRTESADAASPISSGGVIELVTGLPFSAITAFLVFGLLSLPRI